MAGFVYFIEGEYNSLDLAQIEAFGLGYAFTSPPACRQSAMQSPSNTRGLFFADSRRLGDLSPGYYPEDQAWRELPTVEGRPRIFAGYWVAHRPTPDELRRERLIAGLEIKLADGCMWQVPEVREYNDDRGEWEPRLPCLIDYDPAGRIIKGRPLREYRALWDATAALGSRLFESDEVGDDELAACVVALLGANYVVSLAELVILELLTDAGDLSLIVSAACKKRKLLAWLEALQKKSAAPPTPTG